jgi:hypothetical protein
MTRAEFKSLQLRAFDARRVARAAADRLSLPQRQAYERREQGGAVVNRAIELRRRADQLTAELRTAKAEHRGAQTAVQS